jgi:hypothetical protein
MNEELIGVILDIVNDPEYRNGETDFLEEIREIAEQLAPHFDEDYPEELLRHNHPGEEEWAKAYRKHRWTAVSMMVTGRIKTTLSKIQQADDFRIKINDDPAMTGIIAENSFKKYLFEDQPKFKSLEAWAFQIFLDTYLKDANAVVVVLPDLSKFCYSGNPEDIDWSRPYPQIYESEDIHYHTESGCIVRVKDYKGPGADGFIKKWDQFLAISKEGLVLCRAYREYVADENAFKAFPVEYQFEKLPVFVAGNVLYELEQGQPVYESVLQPCVPALNEMIYRHSEIIVNWALHGNPQRWQVVGKRCKTCNGTGKIEDRKTSTIATCRTCNGSGCGESEGSPFKVIEVNIQQPNALNPNVANVPVPPAGYVERDTKALEAQQKDIDEQAYKALAAVGLELLAQVPAAQSGIAKQYDRKEINTFFFKVAVQIETIMIQVAEAEFYQRYNALGIYPLLTPERKMEAMPKITIPSDFDILTIEIVGEQLKKAKDGKFSPVITYGLESDYVQKLYGEDSYQLYILKMLNIHDPLPFLTVNEKTVLKESGGCTEEDYILSNYLPSFIAEMTYSDPNWKKKPMEEQRADLVQMAKDKQQQVRSGLIPVSERLLV